MDEKKLEEFMKRKAAERVIKGYLAIKKVKEEKNYGNEYIKMKYKINAAKYEILYNALEEDIKAECETEIIKEIEDGNLDLDEYLAGLHRERAKTEKTEQKRHGTEKSVSFLRLAAAETKIRQEIWRIHPTKCRKEGQKLSRMTKSC